MYCPLQQPMPYHNIINNLTKQLEHSNSQFITLLQTSRDVIQIVESTAFCPIKKKCEKQTESSITMLFPITPTMIFQF